MAIVLQDPSAALNPTLRVGDQIDEAFRRRLELAPTGAADRTRELLQLVQVPQPDELRRRYSHELSGGQQ